MSRLFVDTNVLVYANVAEAPLHQQALELMRTAADAGRPIWISRQVLREFAAVRSRPQSFAVVSDARTLVERLKYFEAHFHIADDTAAVSARLYDLMTSIPVGGKQIHDANIVATMLEYGIEELITANTSDFRRFSHLIRVSAIENQL